MALEHVKTWRVGDVEISRVVEVNGSHFADPSAGRVVREGPAWKLDVSQRAKVEA